MAAAKKEKIGLLAGSGALPYRVAQAIAKDREVFVIAFQGLTQSDVRKFPHEEFSVLQINAMSKKLKEEGCKRLIFIGKVERPMAKMEDSNLLADVPFALLERLQKEQEKKKQNSDDLILTALASYIEEVEKFTLIGAEQVCPELTMAAGFLSGKASKENEEDVALALKVAQAMGDLNVGQAVVVAHGQVLAVEAAEGTDKMLDRVIALPQALRGSKENRAGVLIKLPRRHQDLRIDMPTIGVKTLNKVAEAGLAGIVFKEKAILIDDKEGLQQAADKAGIFIQALKVK